MLVGDDDDDPPPLRVAADDRSGSTPLPGTFSHLCLVVNTAEKNPTPHEPAPANQQGLLLQGQA